MPMIIPSIVRLTLPDSTNRQVAFELAHRLLNHWRTKADSEIIAAVNWESIDTSRVRTRLLDRVRLRIEQAEADDDRNRLAQLMDSVAECVREANRDISALREDLTGVISAVATRINRVTDPFLASQIIRQEESRIASELSRSQRKCDESVTNTEQARISLDQQRQRAQAIEGNRSLAYSLSNSASSSPSRTLIVPTVTCLLIWLSVAQIVNRFFGLSWTGWLAGLLLSATIFALFLRKRGNVLLDENALGQTATFLDEFKVALVSYVSAQLAHAIAESELRVWTERASAWSQFTGESQFIEIANKLDQVGLLLNGQQPDVSPGFFYERFPGEMLLSGSALNGLILDDLQHRLGRERVMNAVTGALNAQAGMLHRFASASAEDFSEEVVRAAQSVIGKLEFSAVMSLVLSDPQGATVARTWLKRLRDEVLAPATLREGISRDSGVRETLRCGLPGGAGDPLAREIAQRFNCDIQDSTIPNGLELLCISRNIQLDDLATTEGLKRAYEAMPPAVRDVLFNFPSRASAAESTTGADDDRVKPKPIFSTDNNGRHSSRDVHGTSFRRKLGRPFGKIAG